MWTPTTRRQHSRAGLRFETDLTDAERAVIAPLMPRHDSRGRPSIWTPREILNAIFYVLRGGIAWRLAALQIEAFDVGGVIVDGPARLGRHVHQVCAFDAALGRCACAAD